MTLCSYMKGSMGSMTIYRRGDFARCQAVVVNKLSTISKGAAMPKIAVVIQYDAPDDKYWLNPDNVSLCLHKYCVNTKFFVTWAPGGNPWAAPEEMGSASLQPTTTASTPSVCTDCLDFDRCSHPPFKRIVSHCERRRT